MRFTVEKSDLLKKLTPAMGSVSNRNTITSIEGVLVETTEEGTVRITTYDMNKGFRADIPAVSIERDGSYIINAGRLYQTIRVLPDAEITFDIDDNLACTISSGNASFSLIAMRGQDFPNMPDLFAEDGFNMSAESLKKIIGKVSHSIAEQDNRPMLCGAYFKVKENGLDVVSSDSYTLSKCRVNCEVKSINSSNVNFSFIMPGHALGELSKVLSEGDGDEITFYVARRHAIIIKDDIIFFTRTIDSEYIDYERVIPKDNDNSVILERARFLEGLERANIIAEEKIQGRGKSYIKLIFEGNDLTLTSSSINGKVIDEMTCEHDGDRLEIGFNCRFLINNVKAAEGEMIKITMKSPTHAITIEATEEDPDFSYLYMVLPVRMNEQK